MVLGLYRTYAQHPKPGLETRLVGSDFSNLLYLGLLKYFNLPSGPLARGRGIRKNKEKEWGGPV